MSDDFADQPDPEKLRDEAGEPHYFQGIELKPFSFGRQAACQRVGGSESKIENAILLIFMLTLDAKEINLLTRTREGILEFRERMEAFADEHKISIVQDRKGKYVTQASRSAIEVSQKIWEELEAAEFKPESKGNAPPKRIGPGAAADYIAAVSAVLYGSMTWDAILWDLPLAIGKQFQMCYFLNHGIAITPA